MLLTDLPSRAILLPNNLPICSTATASAMPIIHSAAIGRFEGPQKQPISVPVSGNTVSTSGDLLRSLALAGKGIMLAPTFLVGDDVEAGHLVRLLPNARLPELAINAIYPHRHHLSSKVRSFIDLLVKRFAEHRKWMNPGAAAGDQPRGLA